MNISIRDEVYRELKRRRAEDESFSDVIERLLARPSRLTDFIGAWSDLDRAELEGIEARRASRHEADERRRRRLRARRGR